ncbi:AraC family transcriptional regulator [Pseudoluteimonas lycopersici]|uniref:AraC family transcriptional regulator n=1 Tax=Pseudoluteimonas lycopersici TaxID=1324796 RepID=A0A516V499_9GAMM|nr:AraC family transcriptional regulator [Lysobacter lycopersici]QDQ73334.1 AraC family transcriptional regulator [Lysobacter lycopersici]
MNRPIADPRLTTANISTNILAGLCQMADEHGVACAPWFAGLRVARSQIDDASLRVSYRQASGILHRALRDLPVADAGLRLGRRQSIGNFGLLGLAMMTARSFGDAVAIGLQYAPLSGSLIDLELDASDPRELGVIARPRADEPAILPFLCEELYASVLMLCRGLVGPAFRPLRLELTYPAPAYAHEYEALFGCEVRFDMPRNRELVDPAWMEHRLPTWNPVSARQALALCRAQMPGGERPGELVASVRSLLRVRLQDNPRLADIADELHVTERTLRRQLLAAGTGFKQLHDQVRHERARDLLRERDLPIAQVGASVGFRDAREFRRAFKRWTGTTPSQARDARPGATTATDG